MNYWGDSLNADDSWYSGFRGAGGPFASGSYTDSLFFGGGGGGVPIGGGRGPGMGIDISIPIGGGGGGAPRPPSLNRTLTEIVDGYERLLQANLGEFQTGNKSPQAAYDYATATFDRCISELLAYGPQGARAADERDRRRNSNLLRWDWITYYIDPIFGGSSVDPGGGSIPPRVPRGGPNNPPPFTTPAPGGFRPMQSGDNTFLLVLLGLGAVLLLKKR